MAENEKAGAEKPKETSVDSRKLELIDSDGRETGVTLSLRQPRAGAEAELGEVTASAISGWTTMVVDGVEVPYSEENARILVGRFPWVAREIARRYSIEA